MTIDERTMKELIDCFVTVYGEKHRKMITDKISNCLILLCGYKSKEEIEQIRLETNKKYMKLLAEKIGHIIELSNEEITFLFSDNIFKSNDSIRAFNTSSQKIIDSEKKTRAAQFNAKLILKTRESFSSISSKNITTTLADNLIDIFDELVEQAKRELFTSTINYEENKTKLQKINFLEPPIFDLKFYDFENQQHNGVQINFIKDKDGNIILYPIINFSTVKNSMSEMFGAPDYFDVLLIHEINHVIGMHLIEYIGLKKFKVQMGLVVSDAINNRTNYSFMDYIDEAFNQFIAKKVTNLLHSKGVYLLDNPQKSQVNDLSLYEMSEFLLEEFFMLFYDDLINVYAEDGTLQKFYSQFDINDLKSLGLLIQEYLQREDILDISDSKNEEYTNNVKEIVRKLKNNSKNEQIYDVVQLFDLNELESITPEKIKLAFNKMLEKLNISDNSDLEISQKIYKIMLDKLRFALDNIDLIRTSKGINTNENNAKMYQMQKTNLISNLNKKNPIILNTIIVELEKSGFSISKIIRFLNSLEYGLIYPDVTRKLIELFGEETYNALIEYTETNQTDYNKLSLLIDQIENCVLTSKHKSSRNNL